MRGQAGGLLRVLTVVGLALGLWLPAADTHWIEHLPWHQHLSADGGLARPGGFAAFHSHGGSHALPPAESGLGLFVLAAVSAPDGGAVDGVGGRPLLWRSGADAAPAPAPTEPPAAAARAGPPPGRSTRPDTPPPQLAFHFPSSVVATTATF